MSGDPDPYAVLSVPRDASEAQIHAAYRAAVRRAHPDAGGSAGAFRAVQDAYEVLRDPARRAAWDGPHRRPPQRPRPASAPDPGPAGASMEELLAESRRLEAESRRLEDEARRLAGLPPRHAPDAQDDDDGAQDSFAAIARDAGKQLRDAADRGADELARIVRRWL